MNSWLDALLVLLVLVNLRFLGSSRLLACIRTVAMQGILLGVLALMVELAEPGEGVMVRIVIVAAVSIAVKGLLFPWLLTRSLRDAEVRREVEPFVAYGTSLLAGIGMLGAALWIGSRLPPLPGLPLPSASLESGLAAASPVSRLLVPVALFTVMVGLFMIVSRRKALTQVLGYLSLENGIYAFGIVFARNEPMLVELGILLDVFVAVFVMGIAIFHINREFDHIDTDRLSVLKD